MRIAGFRDSQAGWLRIYFERQYEDFVPLPESSSVSVSRAAPAGLCINTLSAVGFLGAERSRTIAGSFAPGMPVACDRQNLAYFERSAEAGKHEITATCGGALALRFEDRDCYAGSCCGFGFAGPGLVVSYFVSARRPSGPGLRMAYWRLARGEGL
jgi:hypothetical protein